MLVFYLTFASVQTRIAQSNIQGCIHSNIQRNSGDFVHNNNQAVIFFWNALRDIHFSFEINKQ